MFGKVLLLLLPSIAFCFDAVVWSSGDAIDRKSPPSLSKLIESATLEKPLVIFALKNFELADFSRHANVYGEPAKATQGLKKWIASSKGYAAEWLDEAAQLPAGKYVEYKGELTALTEQPVVVVRVDSLAVIDDLADNILQSLDRPYTAVLTWDEAISTHAIQKRVALEEGRGAVAKAGDFNAVVSGQFPVVMPVNKTCGGGAPCGCLLYIGEIGIVVFAPNKKDNKVSNTWIKNATFEGDFNCVNSSSNSSTSNYIISSFKVNVPKISAYKGSDFAVNKLSFRLTVTKTATGYWMLNSIDSIDLDIKNNGTFLEGITVGGKKVDEITAQNANASTAKWGVTSVPTYSYACTSTPAAWISGLSANGMDLNSTKASDPNKIQVGIALGKFQLQPAGVKNSKFSRLVDDCVPTFSPGSWMGIITGLILLIGFLFAMSMLNSVQTMDRFDDPKQKQIVINFKE